jgi:hypothetical protein
MVIHCEAQSTAIEKTVRQEERQACLNNVGELFSPEIQFTPPPQKNILIFPSYKKC